MINTYIYVHAACVNPNRARKHTYNPGSRGISQIKGKYSLVPRLFPGEGKEPGTHCMRMRAIAPEFQGDRILLEYVRIL